MTRLTDPAIPATSYAPPATQTVPRPPRLVSIDVVRGAAMVLMALDHVRSFVASAHLDADRHFAEATFGLFVTRWVTHFAAPIFFLLAGTGAALALARGRDRRDAARFLVTRGLWLIVLELTVVAVEWTFSFHMLAEFGKVLWALGWSMIALAGLLWLPRVVIGIVVAVMIAGHNLLDPITPESLGAFGPMWHVLHVRGWVVPDTFGVTYPLVPWIAVMALGWLLADLYRGDGERRRRLLLRGGLAATAGFVLLRAANGYGDPVPWAVQRSAAMSVASFLNATKYPPSLDYLLMTLGPALVALARLERARGAVARWLVVFGRVPMFFYLLHILVAHAMGVLLALAQLGRADFLFWNGPPKTPAEFGVGLPWVYLATALLVALLYVPCRWFAGVKARRKDWWLGYL